MIPRILTLQVKNIISKFLLALGLIPKADHRRAKAELLKHREITALQKKYGELGIIAPDIDYVDAEYWRQREQRVSKKVVYTCITNNYDKIQHHRHIDPNWDYVCFCDDPQVLKLGRVGAWEIRPLPFTGLDAQRNSRWPKILPHKALEEYTYSLWCDGSVNFLTGYIFEVVARKMANKEFVSAPRHFRRDCIYDEADECIRLGKDDEGTIQKHKELLLSKGYPAKNGLYEMGIMFREHHNPKCVSLMEDWWDYITTASKRDQLSFCYIVWKHAVTMSALGDKPLRLDEEHFLLACHYSSPRGDAA